MLENLVGLERAGTSFDKIRLLLVEDHPAVSLEFSDAMRQKFPLAEVHTSKDLPEAQSKLESWRPSVLVVDLGLPSGSGLQLIRTARRLLGNQSHSLLLTVTGNDEFLLRAVECGACGPIYKSDDPSTWWKTIENVLGGGSPASAVVALAALNAPSARPFSETSHPLSSRTVKVAELVASGYTLSEVSELTAQDHGAVAQAMRELYLALRENLPRLTPRELELICLLGKGNGFKQCAALMGVGEATTRTLATRAYSKLGAGNLQTALYEARALGLLT